MSGQALHRGRRRLVRASPPQPAFLSAARDCLQAGGAADAQTRRHSSPRRLVPAPLSVDQGQPAGLPKPGPFYRGSCPPPLPSDRGRDPVQRSRGPALGPRQVVGVVLRPSGCSRQAGINSWENFRQQPHHRLTARGDASPAGPLRLSPAGHRPGGVLCGQPFPPRLTPASPAFLTLQKRLVFQFSRVSFAGKQS